MIGCGGPRILEHAHHAAERARRQRCGPTLRHMRAKPPQMPQKGLCIGKARLNSKVEDVRLMSARRHCAKRRNGRICGHGRSEEHTSELQSLMRISYAVFCLQTKQ